MLDGTIEIVGLFFDPVSGVRQEKIQGEMVVVRGLSPRQLVVRGRYQFFYFRTSGTTYARRGRPLTKRNMQRGRAHDHKNNDKRQLWYRGNHTIQQGGPDDRRTSRPV